MKRVYFFAYIFGPIDGTIVFFIIPSVEILFSKTRFQIGLNILFWRFVLSWQFF